MAKTKSARKAPANYPGHERAYHLMFLGRLIDDEAPNFLRKAMGWSYHAPNAGHDAIQLALGCTFRANTDFLFPYYRDLTTALAGGLTAREILLNGLSRDGDVAAGGRHMSNHFAKPEIGIQNVSSCVSNHIQHAAGLGRAVKHYKSDAIVYCSFGESGVAEGYVYEALNGISLERLPVVTVIQDNGYGISVPKRDQTANECTAENFIGIDGVKIWRVDGRDTLACFTAMHQAADFAAKQKGAAIVYADCVRIGSHSNSDNHILYRDEKELADAKARDPLPAFRKWLIEEGMSEDDLAAIEEQARTEFNDAREFAETAPKPDPASAEQFIFAPAYEPQGSGTDNPAGEKLVKHPEDKKGRGLTLRQGINAALRREFRDNPDTFLWGQDIANKDKEGIFLVTKGMQAEFGDKRIFNGPIAENYILGTANGMSRFDKKIRIVVEGAEFADYFWPAMDQYLECSHEYYRTKGQFTPNVLIRLASGGYIGGGLYHSQTIEGSLANIPGVRIVYPAFADDAYGLVRTAMKSQGPTLFLEPKNLYNDPRTRTQIPEEFEVPFGKARVRKEGTDVVVLTYGNALMMALKAAEELEQEAGGGKQEAGARSASDGETRDPEQIRMSQEAGPGPSAQSGIYAPVTGNPGGTGNPAGVSESNPPTPNSQSATPNTEHRTPNISVAVIDLRSLIPLDEETILDWVKKTGRVVIAHEGPEFGGFGGELAALISKKAFEYLDAPIQRVGARFSPIPFSPILEAQILPQPNWIKQAIVEVAKY